MAANMTIFPAGTRRRVAQAVATAAVGAKGATGCTALLAEIGPNPRLRIRNGATLVVDVVFQGSLTATNGIITLPQYVTLNTLIDATIGAGWVMRVGRSDDSVYVEGAVGNAASSAPFRLSNNPDDNKGFSIGAVTIRFDPAIDVVTSTGSSPPATLSAQRAVDIMVAGPNADDWAAWNYPPNAYGGVVSVGARLKHNSNVLNLCMISQYQDKLATLLLQWLTFSFKFTGAPANHNVAVQAVPRVTYGRIRPDLNSGVVQWIALNNPTGALANGVINPNGETIGSSSETRENGSIMRIPHNYILHPWAVVNPFAGSVNVDAAITALVSQNPADPYADSRLDCIASQWWVRLVPWNPALPIDAFATSSNPVIVVASADPHVGRPRRRSGDPNDSGSPMLSWATDCLAGIAANRPERIGTSWLQVGFVTLTDAPDRHTTQAHSAISSTAFRANLPPGYA